MHDKRIYKFLTVVHKMAIEWNGIWKHWEWLLVPIYSQVPVDFMFSGSKRLKKKLVELCRGAQGTYLAHHGYYAVNSQREKHSSKAADCVAIFLPFSHNASL